MFGSRKLALGAVVATAGATLVGLSAAPGLAAVAAPRAAAVPACTDTWTNTGGGSWDTATNWNHGVPGSSDTVCITAAGSYTVVVGNETITVANLTVGGSGSSPTLAIGNGGSGYPAISVPGTVTAAGTVSSGWGGSFTVGTLAVPTGGTFLVPSTPYPSTMTATTTDVAGAFTVDASLALSLPTSSSSLTNEASGTLTVASGAPLAITSPSGQTGTLAQKGLITNNGSLTIADATVVSGGSICGTPPLIGAGDAGAGGTLSFASTVAGGPACGGSTPTDQLFVPNVTATISGTIPAAYTVSIGDGGSSEPAVTLAGVTNAGTLSFGWGGTLNGALTNTGHFVVPASSYSSTFNTPAVDNTGSISVNAGLTVVLASGSSTVHNESTGTITTATGQTLLVSNASGSPGTVTQQGLITNNGALAVADTLDVLGGSICGNAVFSGANDAAVGQTLAFPAKLTAGPKCGTLASDKIFVPNSQQAHPSTITGDIPKGYTVTVGDGGSSYAYATWTGSTIAGNLLPGFGATITDTNVVTVKGALTVPASAYTTTLDLGGLINDKKLTVNAGLTLTLSGTTFSNPKGAKAVIGTSGALTTNAALASAGSLTLDPNALLTVSGFSQAGTGSLTLEVGTAGNARITSSGSATLAGKLATKVVKVKPAKGSTVTLLTASAVSGTFASATGPYAISYTPTTVVGTYS